MNKPLQKYYFSFSHPYSLHPHPDSPHPTLTPRIPILIPRIPIIPRSLIPAFTDSAVMPVSMQQNSILVYLYLMFLFSFKSFIFIFDPFNSFIQLLIFIIQKFQFCVQ